MLRKHKVSKTTLNYIINVAVEEQTLVSTMLLQIEMMAKTRKNTPSKNYNATVQVESYY